MKKILAVAILSSLVFADDMDFKKGFDMAVKAIQLEMINGSNTNRAMNYHYPKTIYLDTRDMTTNEILLAQYIAFSNGYIDTVFIGEKMYFGSYLREADRTLAKQNLEQLLGKTLKNEENKNKIMYATPILNRNFYITRKNIVESGIKRSEYNDWSFKEISKDKLPNNTSNLRIKKNFFIPKRNNTDAFSIEPSKITNGFVKNKYITKIGITNMTKYRYGSTIEDESGKKYVKAHNQNIFIREAEVDFLER